MSFLAVHTPEAEAWVDDYLVMEDWQKQGNLIGIEHRYIEEIMAGMIEGGLEPGKDFSVV